MRSVLAIVIVLAAIPGALAQGNPAVPPAATLQPPDPPGMPPRSGTYREPAPPRLKALKPRSDRVVRCVKRGRTVVCRRAR